MITWSVAFYVSEWAIRLAMLAVVMRRRQPIAATAWLLVIFFLPWVGLALYLLIGSNRLPRRRTVRHARLLQEIADLGQRFKAHPHIVHPEVGSEATAAVTLAQRLGYMPILGGNDAEMISQPQKVIDRLVADIDAAQHHVHLLFYIFADDDTGRRVADALTRAIERGVSCRVLVDAVGSRPMLHKLAPRMMKSGVEVHEVLPVGLFRRSVARMDLRNHRKIAIIDGHIAYAGSQNCVDAGYGHKHLVWRDLMVRLTGPVVLELQVVFLEDWYSETGVVLESADIFPTPRETGNIPVQALPSGPNYPTENYQRLVVAALHAAHQRVTITTAYFVPDDAFLQAMQTAVLRGVRVELIVPRRSNMVLVGAAGESYYTELLEAGVEVYLHTDGLLHTKAMSIDDAIAFVGSSNFDIRSFALNFEINMLLYGSLVTQALRAKQRAYIENSVRLCAEQWQRRPVARKVFQTIARLLSPLL